MAISQGIRRQKKVRTFKKLKLLSLIFIITALIALGFYFKYSFAVKEIYTNFKSHINETLNSNFKKITYEGADELNEKELNAKIFGDSSSEDIDVLSIDPMQVKSSLEEFGWIEKAIVKRNIDGNINVTIKESTPMAIWQHQKNLSLLDVNGNIITETSIERKRDFYKFRHLPLVVGSKANENVKSFLRMIHTIPSLAENVTAANWIGERRWDVEFNNNIIAKLPENNPNEAWQKLFSMQKEKNVLNKKISSIDLRLTDRTSIAIE